MNFLIIETASQKLQVGLLLDKNAEHQKLLIRQNDLGWKHGEFLQTEIDAVLKDAGLASSELGAVICSHGPGSFTGLRTGLACAKGICAALNIDLIGVSSLDAIAWSHAHYKGLVISCLDAKKNRFYSRVYLQGRAITTALDLSLADIATLARNLELQHKLAKPSLVVCPDKQEVLDAYGLLADSEQKHLLISDKGDDSWLAALAKLGQEKFLNKDFTQKDSGAVYVRNSEQDLGIQRKLSNPSSNPPVLL